MQTERFCIRVARQTQEHNGSYERSVENDSIVVGASASLRRRESIWAFIVQGFVS